MNFVWGNIFSPKKNSLSQVDLIKTLPPFLGLSHRDFVTIERVVHERNYVQGETVFDEGNIGAGLYVIKEGEVLIEKVGGEKPVLLATLHPGDFFGEIALIDEVPRTARASVSKKSVLLAFCKPDLEMLRGRNPSVALTIVTNISKLIAQRLSMTNDKLEILQTKVNEFESRGD